MGIHDTRSEGVCASAVRSLGIPTAMQTAPYPEAEHACKLIGNRMGVGGSNLSGEELTTAARQGQKNTTSQDQARQSCTDDGAGDGHAVERKGRVKRSLASDVGADPQPVGLQELISCPALKIGKTRRERSSRRYDRPRCREPEKVSVR